MTFYFFFVYTFKRHAGLDFHLGRMEYFISIFFALAIIAVLSSTTEDTMVRKVECGELFLTVLTPGSHVFYTSLCRPCYVKGKMLS